MKQGLRGFQMEHKANAASVGQGAMEIPTDAAKVLPAGGEKDTITWRACPTLIQQMRRSLLRQHLLHNRIGWIHNLVQEIDLTTIPWRIPHQ